MYLSVYIYVYVLCVCELITIEVGGEVHERGSLYYFLCLCYFEFSIIKSMYIYIHTYIYIA